MEVIIVATELIIRNPCVCGLVIHKNNIQGISETGNPGVEKRNLNIP